MMVRKTRAGLYPFGRLPAIALARLVIFGVGSGESPDRKQAYLPREYQIQEPSFFDTEARRRVTEATESK